MAGGAYGNQQFPPVDARPAMVDMQPPDGLAGAAGPSVPLQNRLAQAAEALPGAGRSAVAGAAKAGDRGKIAAAGAEEGALGGRGQERLYIESPAIRGIIIGYLKSR